MNRKFFLIILTLFFAVAFLVPSILACSAKGSFYDLKITPSPCHSNVLIVLSGVTEPNVEVTAYLKGELVGSAMSNAEGYYEITVLSPSDIGTYKYVVSTLVTKPSDESRYYSPLIVDDTVPEGYSVVMLLAMSSVGAIFAFKGQSYLRRKDC